MAGSLARLIDLKERLGDRYTPAVEALLRRFLEAATAACAQGQHAGRELTRQAGIVEYIAGKSGDARWQREIVLARPPVEVITSVTEIDDPTESFEEDGEALVQNTDWLMTPQMATEGRLRRIDAYWYLEEGCLRVVYTGGYADLMDCAAGAIPVTPVDEGQPAAPLQIAAPQDLQEAVIDYALVLFNHRATAGVEEVSLGAGGSVRLSGIKPPPSFIAACQRLRRWNI